MAEFMDKVKATLDNMFDGDNQHDNVVDNIEDQMLGKNLESKIDEQLRKIDSEK